MAQTHHSDSSGIVWRTPHIHPGTITRLLLSPSLYLSFSHPSSVSAQFSHTSQFKTMLPNKCRTSILFISFSLSPSVFLIIYPFYFNFTFFFLMPWHPPHIIQSHFTVVNVPGYVIPKAVKKNSSSIHAIFNLCISLSVFIPATARKEAGVSPQCQHACRNLASRLPATWPFWPPASSTTAPGIHHANHQEVGGAFCWITELLKEEAVYGSFPLWHSVTRPFRAQQNIGKLKQFILL